MMPQRRSSLNNKDKSWPTSSVCGSSKRPPRATSTSKRPSSHSQRAFLSSSHPPCHESRLASTGVCTSKILMRWLPPSCAETSRTGWPKRMRRAEVQPVRPACRGPTRSDSAGPATPRTRAVAASRLLSFSFSPLCLPRFLSASPVSLRAGPLLAALTRYAFPYHFPPRSHILASLFQFPFCVQRRSFFRFLCICYDSSPVPPPSRPSLVRVATRFRRAFAGGVSRARNQTVHKVDCGLSYILRGRGRACARDTRAVKFDRAVANKTCRLRREVARREVGACSLSVLRVSGSKGRIL